jgi:hypothetical protein
VVMTTQEIHYASMAQVVETSSLNLSLPQEPKKLWHTVADQARIAPSVWMTEYHHQQLGRARMWLNLIRITVPTVTGNAAPVYQDHYMASYDYHRDMNSVITLETNALTSELDPKTWGFLIYLKDNDEEKSSFGEMMKRVLIEGILPLAEHYFQGFFSSRGSANQAYCQLFKDFVKDHLSEQAESWRLMDCIIGIGIHRMQVEVLFYPARKIPKAWEAVKLSGLEVCPRFGPHERHHNGTSAEFFEKLNRICYMWMPHSNGLYSLPDSPEPSPSDLFGSSMSGSSSIASVMDGLAWAHMDDDSVETDIALTHIDSDGMVTGVRLDLDGTINSISRNFSAYTDCQSVLFKNRFCLSMGEDST